MSVSRETVHVMQNFAGVVFMLTVDQVFVSSVRGCALIPKLNDRNPG